MTGAFYAFELIIASYTIGALAPVIVASIAAVAVILGLVIATNNAATTWVVVLEGVGLLYAAVMGILTELKITR